MGISPFKIDEPLHSIVLTVSPIGPVRMVLSLRGLAAIEFGLPSFPQPSIPIDPRLEPLLLTAQEEIKSYLNGQQREFTLPIDWRVFTPFQARVMRVTAAIPYGEIRTYGQVASAAGCSKAYRAVGGVMARNPIPIVIPCHRVIGSSRELHGYSAPGGLETKAWLLQLEGHQIEHQRLV